MYTRCPACHTVHPVNAALLASGRGRYRCGKCNKTADAMDSLFDEWPDSGQRPAAAGELPVLGPGIDLERAQRSRLDPGADEGDTRSDTQASARRHTVLLRAAWIGGAIALVIAVTIGLSNFQRVEPGNAVATESNDQSALDAALVAIGARKPKTAAPFRDLERIHLVSRELTSHPERPDLLRLNATLVNRAARTQPFPELEITLLDALGNPLTRHRFEPADYLAQGSMRSAGMAPEAYLPLTVDLEDPGLEAVGFELEFH